MADIFVSYSRTDSTFARALAAALSGRGWSVWWDREIPAGSTFDEVIAEALNAARCVIVVWSKESIESDWVREEAEEGRRRDILIPILIEDVRPPLGFSRIHAADMREWDGVASGEPFERLVADIATILGPPPAKPLDAPAAVTTAATSPPHAATAPIRVRPRRLVAQRHWKLAAASMIAAVVLFAAYRFATTDDGSQPRPVMAAAPEPALRLNAVLKEDADPIAEGVAYQVFQNDQDAEGNRALVKRSGVFDGPPKFELPPGRYYATATHGSASASTEVDVRAATLTLQTLNLRAGVVRPTASLADGGKPLPDGVRYLVENDVADAEGNRKRIATSGIYDGPPRFVLPAGRYVVTVEHGSASRGADVDIEAGENIPLPITLQAGILNLSSRLAGSTPSLPDGVSYEVYEAAADQEGKRKRITTSGRYDGPPRLPLPAGRYFVTAEYGSASASGEISLSAGEIKPYAIDLRAGVLALEALAPGGTDPLKLGVTYAVFDAARDAEGNRRRVVGSSQHDGPPRLPLPAGRYYVTASAAQGKADEEVTLRPGQYQQLRLRLRP